MDKLELIQKASNDLRLYLMIGKGKDEKVIAIAGYNLEDTIVKAREKNVGYVIVYNGQNFLVKDLLDKVRMENATIEAEAPEKELTKDSFITGLMLAVDRFVESENDRKSVKRVLGKIK